MDYGNRGMFRVAPPLELKKLEAIFRHKVLRMLLAGGKITQEMITMLSTWRHSGFNVFCGNRISPKDDTAMEHLACYIIRASFSQERMQYLDQEGKGIYMAKDGKKTKIFPAWNGWPPCARIFRTGESGWCVITDTTATSRGENGRRKAALRLSPAFSNRREMKKPSGGTGRD
jgi:hypothetical protein